MARGRESCFRICCSIVLYLAIRFGKSFARNPRNRRHSEKYPVAYYSLIIQRLTFTCGYGFLSHFFYTADKEETIRLQFQPR